MPNKPKRAKSARRAPLTRTQLLPIAPTTARKFSLENHLALVAMRSGRGNADFASILIKTLYLTFLVCDRGRLDPPMEAYLEAESILRASIDDSVTTEGWQIADEQCEPIELVLCAHDEQLASTPLHRFEVAKRRLDHILKAGRFPDLDAMYQMRG
jgi:hypothetical protein